MTEINPKTPMEELTIGGNIYCAGNAREFKTGDWRSMKPIWIKEKLILDDISTEENLIMIIAKDVEFVLKLVHLQQLR